MMKNTVKTLKRLGLMSSVGLIAISTSSFANPSGQANSPVVSANLQVADAQQLPKKLPPPQPKQQQTQQQKQPLQQPRQPSQQQTQQQVQPLKQPKLPLQQQAQQQKQPLQQPGQPLQQQAQQQKQPLQQPKLPLQQQAQQQKQPLQQPRQPLQQQAQQQKQPLQQAKQPLQQQSQQQQSQQGHRYDWATYQPGHRPPQAQQYSQNFDPRPFQTNRDAERSYHSQPYVQPDGWYSRRWVYGETLPTAFWGRTYWLSSYWDYGLMDPPYGYVWVRDGFDALLIDVETGQILSVTYGVFA